MCTRTERPTDGRPRALRTALIAAGALSLVAQVLLLRELMTAWRGNEMSFGVALAVWLTAGGAGSAGYGLFSRLLRPTRSTLSGAVAAIGVLVPLSLIAARALRAALGLSAGEVSGFAPLLWASLLSLAPFTLVAGFTFALATAVVHREAGEARTAAGTVYLLEAAGAACGGVVASFLLLPLANPIASALFLTSASLAVAAALGSSRAWRRVAAVAAVAVAAVALSPIAALIDDASVAGQWRGVDFVSQTNSVHGRIVAVGSGSQKSIYESGVLSASVPDRLSAEETVHLPLLAHPSPERVLLLGGGLGGAVAEVLKHPTVTAVDYVELDPELIREAGRAFGDAMTAGFDDPRVTVHFADARFFVKRAGAAAYDVVVLGAPEPTTARLNRLYTAEFMSEVDAILADDGLLGLAVQSAENYVGPELAAFLTSLSATAGSVFPSVVMYPGDPCHILASRDAAPPPRDAATLVSRVSERGLDVVHVRDYYLNDRLSEDRAARFDDAVRGVEGAVNTDLFPVTYYLSMVLWNRQFSGVPELLPAARRVIGERGALALGAALVLLLALPALQRTRREGTARRAVYAAVVVVGATEISLELTALLAFQSLYGYVYHQLALIVAAFMAGLAAGGALGTRAVVRGAGERSFVVLQLFIAAVPVALAGALGAIAGLPPDALEAWGVLFPVLVVLSAVLAGAQFPIAIGLLTREGGDVGASGGRVYGADLLGAALGATATAVLLLPVMGVAGTMRAFTTVNLAMLAALALALLPTRARRTH